MTEKVIKWKSKDGVLWNTELEARHRDNVMLLDRVLSMMDAVTISTDDFISIIAENEYLINQILFHVKNFKPEN